MFELRVNLAYALGLRRLGTAALAWLVAIAAARMVAVSLAHGTLDGGTTWASLGAGLIGVFFGSSTGMLVQRLADTPLRALLPRVPAPVPTLLLLLASRSPGLRSDSTMPRCADGPRPAAPARGRARRPDAAGQRPARLSRCSCAARDKVAVGFACSRRSPIGSPVTAQMP